MSFRFGNGAPSFYRRRIKNPVRFQARRESGRAPRIRTPPGSNLEAAFQKIDLNDPIMMGTFLLDFWSNWLDPYFNFKVENYPSQGSFENVLECIGIQLPEGLLRMSATTYWLCMYIYPLDCSYEILPCFHNSKTTLTLTPV
jgi:hypothetical protein